MPEHDCLPLEISATEFVAHMAQVNGLPRGAARERTAETLRHVGLFEERYREMRGYSTGMRQRVKLAQALVHDPQLMLLDEPTNGLDPAGRDEMLDLVRRIGTEFGISILMSSHLLTEIERVCDYLVVIEGGRLIRSDSLATFTGPHGGAHGRGRRGDRRPRRVPARAWLRARKRARTRSRSTSATTAPTTRSATVRHRSGSASSASSSDGGTSRISSATRPETRRLSDPGSSSIYDLGYRHYEGERIGRRGTLLTLYVHGLRSASGSGAGRPARSSPWRSRSSRSSRRSSSSASARFVSGLDQDVDIFKHEDYFTYVRIILVLFCATVAPELVGRDQRNRTLSLYFSRAVSRLDYAFAKFAALTSAMLVLTLGPQLLLFIGNGMATDDLGGYIRDNWDLVFPIVAGSLLVSAAIASVGLCIAAYLPRRAYSTAAIVGVFILTLAIAHILMETIDPAVARYFLLVSPVAWEGVILWLFRVDPDSRNVLADAGLGGWVYLLAVLATIAAAFALTLRRFGRVST